MNAQLLQLLGQRRLVASDLEPRERDVLRIHPLDPGVVLHPTPTHRSRTDRHIRCDDAVRQSCRTRQRMWAAARGTRNAEAADSEVVGHPDDIVDVIDDTPAVTTGGLRVARPVAGDEQHAEVGVQPFVRPAGETTAWAAVVPEDRETIRITPQRKRNRPAIRCNHCPQALRKHRTTIQPAAARFSPLRRRSRVIAALIENKRPFRHRGDTAPSVPR